jgi:ElaB/YqjD/DUF883 family membrane-anchored ribosome-binding protein
MNAYQSKTQEIIAKGQRHAKQHGKQVANVAEHGKDKFDQTVESRPGESVLISYVAGVGFGLLIGVLLSEKPSKKESLYSSVADQVREGFAGLKERSPL